MILKLQHFHRIPVKLYVARVCYLIGITRVQHKQKGRRARQNLHLFEDADLVGADLATYLRHAHVSRAGSVLDVEHVYLRDGWAVGLPLGH